MLRLLLKEVKEYKKASIATPIFMILEVAMEMSVPFLMSSIIAYFSRKINRFPISLCHIGVPIIPGISSAALCIYSCFFFMM